MSLYIRFSCLPSLDIDFQDFQILEPRHIEILVPNLSERIKFESLYKQFIADGMNCLAETTITTASNLSDISNDIPNNAAISVDQICANEIKRCIVYQNLNIRTAQDILNIQSIELKVVYKNYTDNHESLQSNERLIVARAVIHHLLVSNLERT